MISERDIEASPWAEFTSCNASSYYGKTLPSSGRSLGYSLSKRDCILSLAFSQKRYQMKIEVRSKNSVFCLCFLNDGTAQRSWKGCQKATTIRLGGRQHDNNGTVMPPAREHWQAANITLWVHLMKSTNSYENQRWIIRLCKGVSASSRAMLNR